MEFLKLKKDKKRYITSIFILLFYSAYFLLGIVSDQLTAKNDFWISNIFFLLLNICLLSLINYEILKLYSLNNIKFIVLIFTSFILMLVSFLVPFPIEIHAYFPYRKINLNWIHDWFYILFYFLIYLIYLLIFMMNKNITFKIINKFFFLTLFIIFCFKAMTIMMLSSTYGWTSLLYLFIIVIFTDTFSYLGGSLYGKNKLAKNISPNKTVEGFLIGMLFGTIFSLILVFGMYFGINNSDTRKQFVPFLNLIQENSKTVVIFIYISFSIVLSVISQFGDLFFSRIKRKNSIKDFSNFLPGHGGILDRMDSILFVSLFAFAFTQLIEKIPQ